jgi:uncharacterized protein (TIGR03437 family)
VNTNGLAAGVYNTTVVVTPSTAGANSVVIPVSLTLNPLLTAAPSFLEFEVQPGTTTPVSQVVTLTPPTSASVAYIIGSTPSWLTVTPASGNAAGTLTVSVDPTQVVDFSYTVITIYASDNSTVLATIPVNAITGPALTVTRSSLSFVAAPGGPAPAPQTVQVATGATSQVLSTQATSSGGWLSASPRSGTTPATLTVSVDPSKLTSGVYYGYVYFSAGGSTGSIYVTVNVGMQLSASPAALTFSSNGTAASSQTLTISSVGTSVDYTATANASWLSVLPPGGSTPGQLTVTANPIGLAPGTYTGVITVGSSLASNAGITVPVTLIVASNQPFSLVPSTIYFVSDGVTDPQPLFASILGTAGQTFNIASSAPWLTVTPASGLIPSSLTLTPSIRGLAAGNYTATVTANSVGTGGGTQSMTVNFTIGTPPQTTVAPTAMTFAFQRGGTAPASQTLTVTAPTNQSYTATASVNAPWLTVTPAQAMGSGTLSVSANPTGLTPGSYTGYVTLTSPALTVLGTTAVTLTVTDPVTISASPASLTLAYQIGSSAPTGQSLSLLAASGSYTYTLTSSAKWLSVTPATGTSPGSATLTVNPTGLTAGTYQGTIQIASPSAANSPQTVNVTLNVSSEPVLTAAPTTLSVTYHSGDQAPDGITLSVGSSSVTGFSVSASSRGWLDVTPTQGTTPGSVTVWVNPYDMPPGQYQGQVLLQPAGALAAEVTVPVSLTVVATPSFDASGVMNAASYQLGSMSPGSMVSVYGSTLAIQSATGTLAPLTTTLGGTQVKVNGIAAPLYSVSPGQITFQVPFEVSAGPAVLTVVTEGVSSAPLLVTVSSASPGISIDGSHHVIMNQNSSPNSASQPASSGSVLTVYLTGLGAVVPALGSGQPAPGNPPSAVVLPVTAQLGGQSADVLFSGPAPGMAGIYQVNVRVPTGLTAGSSPLVITAGTAASNSAPVFLSAQ